MKQKKCEYYGIKRYPPPYLDCWNCEVGRACNDEYFKNISSKQTKNGENDE